MYRRAVRPPACLPPMRISFSVKEEAEPVPLPPATRYHRTAAPSSPSLLLPARIAFSVELTLSSNKAEPASPPPPPHRTAAPSSPSRLPPMRISFSVEFAFSARAKLRPPSAVMSLSAEASIGRILSRYTTS